MKTVLTAIFTILIGISMTSPAYPGDRLVLESALGIGSKVTPFSPEWSGAVGSDGLFFKEYATRISYSPGALFTTRCTFGWLAYYHKDNIGLAMPPWPEPDYWGPNERIIKAVYINPSVRTTLPMMSIDTGLLLYDDNDDGYWFYQANGTLKDKFHIAPSIGLELGDGNSFLFGRLFDSFPLFSGGGIWEFGIGYRSDRLYEQKVYLATYGTEMAGLGIRGEFKVRGQSGLSFGFLVGGRDHETIYNFTLGFIYHGLQAR